jgi:hypothetical protein
MHGARDRARVFKTAWFSRAARKALIADDELCSAMHQVMLGQADDLGGGVYKKRLGKNLYRSIIIARAERLWVYEFLFSKQNRPNISKEELAGFRQIAKGYQSLTGERIEALVREKEWTEICNDNAEQIQE